MRTRNPLGLANGPSRLEHAHDLERKFQKALPHGESPEPPPLKQIETPPPGWQTRKAALASGEEVTQWFRPGVQRGSMKEAWDLAIQEAHETLQAVAGRYVFADADEDPEQAP